MILKTKEVFQELFLFLEQAHYFWEPLIPEQLVKLRTQGHALSRLSQYFGLGLQVDREKLRLEGLASEVIEFADSLKLAISRPGKFYVPHSHWSPNPESPRQYVHFGRESVFLIQQLYRYWNRFENKRILDLGCGSGPISLELGQIAEEILGLDSSEQAIAWATASADLQGNKNIHFTCMEIGDRKEEARLLPGTWDIALFNPPLAIPKVARFLPHRDGGRWGIELPLLFLDFSYDLLKPLGEVYCLMSNPFRKGRSLLLEELKSRSWMIQESICLDQRFNHHLYKEDLYEEQGIERVELCFFRLQKKS